MDDTVLDLEAQAGINLEAENEVIITNDSNATYESISNAVNAVPDVPDDMRNLAVAFGIAMQQSRSHAVPKTVQVKPKERASEAAKLSYFNLDTDADEVDDILGDEFADFDFDSELSRALTKHALLQKALRKIPVNNDNRDKIKKLEDELDDLNLADSLATFKTKVTKEATERARNENLALSVMDTDSLRPPPVGRRQTLNSQVLKQASSAVQGKALGENNNKRNYLQYLRLIRNLCISNDLGDKAAYELTLALTTGDPNDFVSLAQQDGEPFRTTFTNLQTMLKEPSKALELQNKLEKLIHSRPILLGKVLLGVWTVCRQLKQALPIGQRKQAAEQLATESAFKILAKWYPNFLANVKAAFEKERLHAHIAGQNFEAYTILAGLVDKTVGSTPPLKGPTSPLVLEEAGMMRHDTPDPDPDYPSADWDRQSQSPATHHMCAHMCAMEPGAAGARPKQYPQNRFGDKAGSRGAKGNPSAQRQGAGQGYPQKTQPTRRLWQDPKFEGRCFLCNSFDHRWNQCRTYPQERPGNKECGYCGALHVSTCRNQKQDITAQIHEAELQEGDDGDPPEFPDDVGDSDSTEGTAI